MCFKALSTLLCGAEITASLTNMPPLWYVKTSSIGAAFSTALTKTSTGFWPVFFSIIIKASNNNLTFVSVFPVQFLDEILCFFPLWPGTNILFSNLSTMLTFDLWNFCFACLPPDFGKITGCRETYASIPLSVTLMPSKLHLSKSFISDALIVGACCSVVIIITQNLIKTLLGWSLCPSSYQLP